MNIFPNQIARVDGWPINIANMSEAVTEIRNAAKRQQSFAAFTLNLDHLVKLRHDEAFQEAYRAAGFVMADGAPVAYLASRSGRPVSRTTGADLLEPLARAAAEDDLGIYLFGTTQDTVTSAGRHLQNVSDQALRIVEVVSPPFGFDPTGPLADAALDQIGASGAQLCFVALSPPKGEIFAARGVARGITSGFICIGAGLDFLSGRQVRAPKVFQRAGIEWAWRLASDPQRFAVRYAKCALLLANIAMGDTRSSAANQRSN